MAELWTGSVGTPVFWVTIGVLLGGLVLAGVAVLGKLGSRRGGAGDPDRARPVDSALETALAAHADGRLEEAFERISELLARTPDDCDALIAMWDVAIDLGRPMEASSAMLRVVREEVRGGSSSAIEHWHELSELGLQGDADPGLLIHLAALLREADQPDAARDALERALDAADDWDATVVASRVAQACCEFDPLTAERAARQALGRQDLALEERRQLESLLAGLQRAPGQADARVAHSAAADPTPPDDALPTAETAEDGPRPDPGGPAPIDPEVAPRPLQVVEATPIELHEAGLVIEAEGGVKKRIPYARIDGIAAVSIEELGDGAVIVIDLTLNWFQSEQSLRLIRLRADRFDSSALAGSGEAPLDATRRLIERLLRNTGAHPLSGRESARGLPFAAFADLVSYERRVLSAQRAPASSEAD